MLYVFKTEDNKTKFGIVSCVAELNHQNHNHEIFNIEIQFTRDLNNSEIENKVLNNMDFKFKMDKMEDGFYDISDSDFYDIIRNILIK